MDKESQKILDALKLNRDLMEAGIKDAEAYIAKLQEPLTVKSNNSEVDAAIEASLKLLAEYGEPNPLNNLQYTEPAITNIPIVEVKPATFKSFEKIVAEAHQNGISGTKIEDLLTLEEIAQADREYYEVKKAFSNQTKLSKSDIALLIITVALQVTRQFVFSNEKFRFNSAADADKAIKKPLGKVIPKHWHEFLLGPVPYDAVARTNPDGESTGLSGNTHRYRTLGHDPILGWIFGPVNILTSSLTKSNLVTTYEVIDMKIGDYYPVGTMGALNDSVLQAQEDKLNLPAAIVKQAIHFGTDYFTKQGLPLPFISTLDNEAAQKLVQQYNIDTYSVTRGATLSTFINSLIGTIHMLFYNPDKHGSRELYEVRTRKILLIANTIATSSNLIYVALSKDLKKLDLGGLIVTIARIFTDLSFISKIQQEYIINRFDETIQKDLDFLDSRLNSI